MIQKRKSRSVKATEDGLGKLEQAKVTKSKDTGKRWSLEDVANKARTDPKTVGKFFRGERVDKSTASAVCDALDLQIAEIIDDKEVDINYDSYVERPPIESDCCRALLQEGSLIRIKAPRQMGKTLLMSKLINYAENQKCRTVNLNLQEAQPEDFSNLDKFLQWFCTSIASEIELTTSIEEYWKKSIGNSKIKCRKFFEKYLLPGDKPLALALDKVDRIFRYREIAGEFLGMLRTWHEDSKTRPIWGQLRQIVLHTENYIDIDPNQSPFNAGLEIELIDFDKIQVLSLAKNYGLNWSFTEVDKLMNMVGGHPYLVNTAFEKLAPQYITIEEFLQTAPIPCGIYQNHLQKHWNNLQSESQLIREFRKVIIADKIIELNTDIDTDVVVKLNELGLVKLQNNIVMPRYELYRRYFYERLKSI
jgi:DNA-binding Xre family transcriptional regulator